MKLQPGSPLALFVRTFLPSFSRSTVTDQIDLLRDELKSKTLPPYKSALDNDIGFRGKTPFSAAWNKNTDVIFKNSNYQVKNREFPFQPQNYVEMVGNVLDTMDAKLKQLDELITKSFDDSIVNSQLSYMQANLLRLAELTEFYLLYSRKLLIYCVQCEFEHLDAKVVHKSNPLVKADIAWLDNNLRPFVKLTEVYSQNKEDFIRAIKSIPDLVVTDDQSQSKMAQGVYGSKLDPMGFGFIPYYFNPIYHVQNAILQWRHSRIEAAKTEREYLEIRIQQYRLKLGGQDNAKMESVIATTEERMKKLNKKIAEMEESYAESYGL